MGYPLRLGDVSIETLVPKGTPIADLPTFDAAVAARAQEARDKKTVLRYFYIYYIIRRGSKGGGGG